MGPGTANRSTMVSGEDEATNWLTRLTYAGAATQEQAEALLGKHGIVVRKSTSTRHWTTRRASGVAQRVVRALIQDDVRLERYIRQIESVATGIARRLRDGAVATGSAAGEREQAALVQRYLDLMKCLRETVSESAERKRGASAVSDGPTLAALLGEDERDAGDGEVALRNTTRKAAAASGTLFEATGAAR